MVFSRVSIEFGTGSPTSPQVDDDDEAGSIRFQNLLREEIDCVGYFPAVTEVSATFSNAILSIPEREAQNIPSLPAPSPPCPLEHHPTEEPAPQHSQSPSQTLHTSPSWAHNGLCITGLESSSSGVITEETVGDVVSEVNASISHEEYAPLCTTASDHRQLDHPLPNQSIKALLPVHIDDRIPDDFVGVLNVGYPLRPSIAHSDLACIGLGLPIPSFDKYPGEESMEVNMDTITPDLAVFLEESPDVEFTPFLAGGDVAVGSGVGSFLNARPLFVIAEEEEEEKEEDWCSVDEGASC